MGTLERIVEGLEGKSMPEQSSHKRIGSMEGKVVGAGCHPSFRLWLTTYTSEAFPTLVLQKGIKIVNEPPAGLKANLQGSFTGNPAINSADKFDINSGLWRRLVFSLCAFHALIQERHNYGALGWNELYNFTPSDLEISIKQLH